MLRQKHRISVFSHTPFSLNFIKTLSVIIILCCIIRSDSGLVMVSQNANKGNCEGKFVSQFGEMYVMFEPLQSVMYA